MEPGIGLRINNARRSVLPVYPALFDENFDDPKPCFDVDKDGNEDIEINHFLRLQLQMTMMIRN